MIYQSVLAAGTKGSGCLHTLGADVTCDVYVMFVLQDSGGGGTVFHPDILVQSPVCEEVDSLKTCS